MTLHFSRASSSKFPVEAISQRRNKPIIGIIPTINGYHIVCHPFDCSTFSEDIKVDAEIKKHGLTLLYA